MNLYHYCSNANFLAILSTQEIWASDFSLSNDKMEGRWIREVFKESCIDKKVSSFDQTALLDHLDAVMALTGGAGFCMSEEGDLLSQWRAYADNGAGVSIGFSQEYFEILGALKRDRNDSFNASLTKIEYDITKQKTLIAEHLDEILKLVSEGALRRPTILTSSTESDARWRERFQSFFVRFIFFFFFLYSMKNPAFAEEREWRVISHLIKGSKSSKFDNADFHPLTDRIVPFTRIKLEPLNVPSLIEVVLGPQNITPPEIVIAALLKHGWENVAVRPSKASYRT